MPDPRPLMTKADLAQILAGLPDNTAIYIERPDTGVLADARWQIVDDQGPDAPPFLVLHCERWLPDG